MAATSLTASQIAFEAEGGVAAGNLQDAVVEVAGDAAAGASSGAAASAAVVVEATARIAADTTLTTAVGLKASTAALTAETTARTDADTALDGRLATVESSRVQDEGVDLPKRKHLDFVGVGVTATDDAGGDRSVITIPGGGSAVTAFDSQAIVKRYKTLADRQAEQRAAAYFTELWADRAAWTLGGANVGSTSGGRLFGGSFVASNYILQRALPAYGDYLRMVWQVTIVHTATFNQMRLGVHGEPQMSAAGVAAPSRVTLLFQQNSDTSATWSAEAPTGSQAAISVNAPTNVAAGTYQCALTIDRDYVHLSVTPADGSWEYVSRVALAKGGEGPVGLTATAVGSGGTHTAGAKFWVITFVNNKGETSRSNEATATMVLNDSATLAWPTPPLGTTAVKVYRATTAGGQYAATQLVATLAGTATGYTDTGSALTTGTPPVPRPKFIICDPLDGRTTAGNSFSALAVTGSRTRVPLLPAGIADGGAKVLRARTPTALDLTRISLPPSWDSEVATDLVVYLHGAGSLDVFTDPTTRPFATLFNAAGYIVSSAIFGNSGVPGTDGSVVTPEGPSSGYFHWGSNSFLDFFTSHIEYAMAVAPINRILLWGNSMGGLGALNVLGRRRVPGIVGLFGTQPVTNLANMHAGSYQSSIRTVYGIAGDGSDYAAKTAGHDPNLMSAATLRDLPTLLVASPSDTIVSKAQNTDLIDAKLTNCTVLAATGDHGNASHFDSTIQAAAVAFAATVFPAE